MSRVEVTKRIKEIKPETLFIGIKAFEKAKSDEVIEARVEGILNKPPYKEETS